MHTYIHILLYTCAYVCKVPVVILISLKFLRTDNIIFFDSAVSIIKITPQNKIAFFISLIIHNEILQDAHQVHH